MIAVAVVVGLILGVLVGQLILKLRQRRPFLATTEYWVYLPGVQLPQQEAIMHRMLADNPYGKGGVSPIGPKEGILFSDIRLHIALVLRSKNPHAFRPDLFSEWAEPTQEQIEILKDSQSLAKVRFISDTPVPEKRQISFAIHAADAIAELGGGSLLYDLITERIWDRTSLVELLQKDPTGTGPDLNLRVVWKPATMGGSAETRGLKKIGVDELATSDMEADERVLVTEVLAEAASSVWQQESFSESLEVRAFDDEFRLQPMPIRNGRTLVRILRVQPI